MTTRRLGVHITLLALTMLGVGLAAGWGGGAASAGQRVTLAKVVDLDEIPGTVGLRADWTHVVYLKRTESRHLTRLLNDLHRVMAERGWHYRQMMPHMEDGDLRGVWVVYTERPD